MPASKSEQILDALKALLETVPDAVVVGSAVVATSDYFEQTSGPTKNVAADELTWFAIEVVE